MKKFKKVCSICFALLLVATAAVTGALASEGLSPLDWAKANEGKMSIQLVQQQRLYDVNGNPNGLEEFKDNKILVPLVESAQYNGSNFDKYGMTTADGYVDQIVRVKNTGDVSAYVRVIVAIPAALDNANDAGHNALHWNLGNRFMPDGNFDENNNINTAYSNISWKFSKTDKVYGVDCNIYIFTYNDELTAGKTTDAAAFVGFYLDPTVEIVDGHILLDGMDTGFREDTVKIHVKAQAVQRFGFTSAEQAFRASELSDNPWPETDKEGTL